MKLVNAVPFSSLHYLDWFIDESGHVGICVSKHGKLEALFLSPYYGCIQNMIHSPPVQCLENVQISYEYVQKVIKDVVVTREVSESTKGHLSFNEVPF